MDTYANIWAIIKWFFCDFCIQVITAPIGILKDLIDISGITWQIICIIGVITGIVIGFITKYIKNRM